MSITNGAGRRVIEAWAYDDAGNVVRNRKGDESITEHAYDCDGNLERVRIPPIPTTHSDAK